MFMKVGDVDANQLGESSLIVITFLIWGGGVKF